MPHSTIAAGEPGRRRMKLLIVDDEPVARSALLRICERTDDVEVVGQAHSGAAAIAAARDTRPDLMLLDVELPDMSGFDVLNAVCRQRKPLAILVASRPDHAVNAFAAGVLDYLVKPVNADRFARAIERARAHEQPAAGWLPAAPLRQTPTAGNDASYHLDPCSRLLVGEREHRLYPLEPDRIDFIESAGNYVTINSGSAQYISRDSIKRLSDVLACHGFIRIERSLLMNIRSVLYVERLGRGSFAFTLSAGPRLQSSATYREQIMRTLRLGQLPSRRPARP
jgi:two-component system LytT family response regulator